MGIDQIACRWISAIALLVQFSGPRARPRFPGDAPRLSGTYPRTEMLTESRQVNTLDETSSHTGTSRHKLHDWPEGPNRALDGAAEDPAACQLRVPHCRRAQSCNLGSLFRWMRQTPDFGAKPLGEDRGSLEVQVEPVFVEIAGKLARIRRHEHGDIQLCAQILDILRIVLSQGRRKQHNDADSVFFAQFLQLRQSFLSAGQ